MPPYAVWVAALATAVVCALDWWAVSRHRRAVERWAKPGAMVGLLAVATLAGAADTASGRWLLLALSLGLLGDVLLLDESSSRFVGGLAAFLVGHLAYVSSFVLAGLDRPVWGWLGVGTVVACLAAGRRILPGAVADGGAVLGVAVATYMLVIGAMAVTGWATGRLFVGLGVSLFVVSDTVLATGRFVQPRPWTAPVTMVTYHGAQALIVLGIFAS